jgi:hypothetical protein
LLGSISTLQKLDLSSNNIGADGATHVADAIRDNRAMLVLNLSDNDVGGYYKIDWKGDDVFVATPEGRDFVLLGMHITSLLLSLRISQVLLLSLMPSRIWGLYHR